MDDVNEKFDQLLSTISGHAKSTEEERFIQSSIRSCVQFPTFGDYNFPRFSRIEIDLMRSLMEEGDAYGDLGNGGIQLDGKMLQTFQKSFVQAQNIFDQNRLLINEINQNHESKIPDNLSRNVGLIRELNNNIRKVVDLYSDLSSNFTKSMDVNNSSEGDSRLDAKKRTRPS
ncbi:hypothetical protein L1887_38052 [Cichorium endivia]|nr:hypothetical protein L1887_38052 [Cichorium endivia]